MKSSLEMAMHRYIWTGDIQIICKSEQDNIKVHTQLKNRKMKKN